MKIFKHIVKFFSRLIWTLFLPLYVAYLVFPPIWVLNIPYWVLTDRDLFNDLEQIYF